MRATTDGRAAEALRLAEADPRRAVPLATGILLESRRGGDFATASVAARALGLAALHLQDPDAALRQLRSAAALGQRAGSATLAAEARMRLAFVLNVRGRPRQALREIDAVLRDLDGAPRARAQAQRAAIMHQLGRLDEALAGYRTALPALRQAGDDVWVKRVLSNRGVLHGQRHEFAAAQADLTEAELLCRQLDQGLTLAFIQQNLGWVCSRRGDIPLALDYLDQAEQRLRSLHSQLGWVLTDRSELLLSVGLVTEARQAAELAVRAFERERRQIALPEVRLLLARAASLTGDGAGALAQSRRAAREFTRQQRPQWAALARFTVLEARLAGAPGPPVSVAALERAADSLTAAGWRAAALDARLRAGQLAIGRGWTSRGIDQLRQASRPRRAGPAALRSRAWHAEALLRQASGNAAGANTAVRTALRIIDEHRATFGATDLRAHASGHRVEVAELGLRLAFADGRPDRILAAAEQGRASHLLMPLLRPPDDAMLADALAELRATVSELGKLRSVGGPASSAARLAQRQVALERTIRDRSRRQTGQSGAPVGPPPSGRSGPEPANVGLSRPVPPRLLAEALGERALVEFVQLDDVLHAVTVAAGRLRLHRLGPLPPIRQLIDRIPFGLRLLARPGTSAASRAAALVLLRAASRGLDDMLLAPLAAQLGDRPLVLVPTDPLHALPWSTQPSCAGRPVTVAPSAALWFTASTAPPPQAPTAPTATNPTATDFTLTSPTLTSPTATDFTATDFTATTPAATTPAATAPAGTALTGSPVVVVAGPGLPGAQAEAAAIAAIHSTRALDGSAATVTATLAALNGARLAHLAAHGRVHPDNPLFSALLLADGPLTAYDLERLPRLPGLVILAACDSGRLVVRAGDELLGLSATLLSRGANQIVAAVVPVPDAETTPLMVELHRLLAAGEPPPAALATAQQKVTRDASPAAAAAAGFVCLGG
jgi:CHAT domain-containing protein/tetratricopeptide (TPR) repeat protein